MKRKKRSQRKDINGNGGWSKVNFPKLKQLKKFNYKSPDGFKKYRRGICESGVNEEISQSEFNAFKTMFSLVDGYVNYYIESDELFNFLCNTKIGEKTKEEIMKIMPKISNKEISRWTELNNGETTHYSADSYSISGCVHSKKIKKSLFFNAHMVDEEYFRVGVTDGNVFIFITHEHKWNRYDWDIVPEDSEDSVNFLKPVINLLYYMSAFPEYVLDTPPDECLDKLNENNSKTIRISKEIADYLHETRDVSPHLRRGHFRYLSSDRFKNKKGQCVFVKPSFVKGNAKTIIDGGNI